MFVEGRHCCSLAREQHAQNRYQTPFLSTTVKTMPESLRGWLMPGWAVRLMLYKIWGCAFCLVWQFPEGPVQVIALVSTLLGCSSFPRWHLSEDLNRNTFPAFWNQTFKEIFVRLLADSRDNKILNPVTTHKEYIACNNCLEKLQTNSYSSQQTKISSLWGGEKLKFQSYNILKCPVLNN